MLSPSSSVALSGLKATIELEELEAGETGVEDVKVEGELWDSTGAAWDAGSEAGSKATVEFEELEAEETGVEEMEVEDIEDELFDNAAAARDEFSVLSTASGSVAGSKATTEFEELGVEETGLEEIEAKETEVEVPACGNAAEDFKRHPVRNETNTFFKIEGGLA